MISAYSRQHNDFTRVQLRLNASIQDADQLSRYVEHLLDEHVVPKQSRFNITVCISEAINNVVEHGHYTGLHRPVRCILELGDNALSVDLFDMAQQYTPPLDNGFDITEEDGRGWFILKKLSDAICYERRGQVNHLRISFKLS